MGIAEQVAETVREAEKKLAESKSFRELRDFYAEMQQRGMVVKKEYDLPLLDTIGRDIYRAGTDK